MISNTELFGNDLCRTESGGAKFFAGKLQLLRHIYVRIAVFSWWHSVQLAWA